MVKENHKLYMLEKNLNRDIQSECDICYNSFTTINILKCCKGKRICIKCKDKYNCFKCPFCRQNMNKQPFIVIINKNFPCPKNGNVILSVMNYNIVRLWS